MYDGNRACWTDFCDLIFRKGNEKFRTCVRMCVRAWIEWGTLNRLLGSDVSER